EGRTFERERPANPKPTGACGCCGMRAFADSKGSVYLLYRAANEISRDMTLLVSCDQAASFQLETVNQWTTKACPMSTCGVADGSGPIGRWISDRLLRSRRRRLGTEYATSNVDTVRFDA